MENLLAKFMPEDVETVDDEGVVAIEYVVVAAAIVIALGALWTAFGGQLSAKLQDIVDSITVGGGGGGGD